MENTLFIWDSEHSQSISDGQVFLWQSYAENESGKSISIPRLVEENSVILKARYLAWVHDLGEANYNGKRVIDHLKLRPGFSFWWMTLFAEKCNYETSPQITNAIRFLAFDMFCRDNTFVSVHLTSDCRALAECFQNWCLEREIPFFWDIQPLKNSSFSIPRRVYHALPNAMQALVNLGRHIWTCRALQGVGVDEWKQSTGEITFFSYLAHLIPDNERLGSFRSRFWTTLPDELSKNGCKTNWLHIYCADSSHPTAGHAKVKIEKFNRVSRGDQVHTSLESFLSASVVFKTLKDWFSILSFAKSLEQTISSVDSEGVCLWPLYKKEWYSSIIGPSSIKRILDLNLFEIATQGLTRQRIGVYLYEQQAWELALIQSWKRERHGVLVGCQHATMLYWDLRYYHDPRNYLTLANNELPMPNLVAINGEDAMGKALDAGYPATNLIKVEALRYLYLEVSKGRKNVAGFKSTSALRLLVLGDYSEVITKRQMDLLIESLTSVSIEIVITVKPHPVHSFDPANYPNISLELTTEPLEKLLINFDVAYVSPATSAAVDAYCFGLPVITMLDPKTLNLNALRNCAGVFFVSTPIELSEAINVIKAGNNENFEVNDYFETDLELSRWKKLLLESY